VHLKLTESPCSARMLLASDAREVDCVISDVAMPAVVGLASPRVVRSTHSSLPIVRIIGHHELASTDEADRGGRIVREKPFDREGLPAADDCGLRVAAGGE
jgi:FixJ family two-component response regulator